MKASIVIHTHDENGELWTCICESFAEIGLSPYNPFVRSVARLVDDDGNSTPTSEDEIRERYKRRTPTAVVFWSSGQETPATVSWDSSERDRVLVSLCDGHERVFAMAECVVAALGSYYVRYGIGKTFSVEFYHE